MRKTLRNVNVWALAVTVAATTSIQAQGPAAGQAQQSAPYVVGQAKPPATPGRTLQPMTLEQAIQRALEKNLDLHVARMNPESVDYQIRSARAVYMPTFSGSYSYNNSKQTSSSTLDGVSRITSQGQSYNGSMSQTTPWYGGRLTASFNNSRSTTNSVTARINPNYSSSVRLGYTQPLLAGFRIDNQRNTLETLQIQRQIADIQLQTQVEQIAASVRQAYWTLKQRIEQIEISRQALEQAQTLLQDNRIKVEIGTLAPIETAQSEAQVAQQQQGLLNAEIQWRNADLALKSLLVDGPGDELYGFTIDPIEVPTLTVQTVDIEGAIQNALGSRTDMVQARRQLDVTRLNLRVTEDSLKPDLTMSTQYTLQGQGGNVLQGGQVVTPGGYLDALGAIAGFDTPAWNVSFNFSYPLGMVAAKANYARQTLSLRQAEAQLKAQELDVSTQVTTAGLAVDNAYRQYLAAQQSRQAQELNTQAAVTRLDVGMATNFEVVQQQNSLRSARLSELNAIISYVNAVAEFARIQRIR
jgi:outer membrane protein TolC